MRTFRRFFSLNPVVGCTIGCPYCYAREINRKHPQVDCWHEPQFFPNRLQALYARRAASVFFLSTMNDPSDWLKPWADTVRTAVEDNPRHTYLLLSKRPRHLPLTGLGSNLWLGATITCREELARLGDLGALPAQRRFLSFEPLHGALGPLDLTGIHWVWIGAETGFRPEKTACKPAWVEEISAQCREQGVPFFLHHSLKGVVPLDYPPPPEDFLEGQPGLFD